MSDADQSGAGRREVAYRLFAAEYDDADFSYSESDEERAPNYVITPSGARVNRLFVVGVLTEVEEVSDDVLRGRVVDPTGAFVCYAGQYQPDEQAFLERVEPPTFVAMTGKARTFQPEDSDQVYTSVRPESLNEVDAETRDRWTLQAAQQTVARVRTMAGVLERPERGDDLATLLAANDVDEGLAHGIPLALDHYGTGPTYLRALYDLAVQAGELVAGERDEVDGMTVQPAAGGDADLSALSPPTFDRPDSLEGTPESGTDASPGAEAAEPGSADEATPAEADDARTGAGGAEVDAEAATESTADTAETTDGAPSDLDDSAADESAAEPLEADAQASDDQSETAESAADATDTSEDADEVGDFDSEFDLDQEERAEVEAEYGTEFQSGTEVDEPGEADIDTPDPDEVVPETDDGESATGVDASDEAADAAASTSTDEADTGDGDGSAADVDLEDLVVTVMEDLDEGEGADRATVVETAVDRSGADQTAVEDAIQDALMDGRCYEPDDGTLQPI